MKILDKRNSDNPYMESLLYSEPTSSILFSSNSPGKS